MQHNPKSLVPQTVSRTVYDGVVWLVSVLVLLALAGVAWTQGAEKSQPAQAQGNGAAVVARPEAAAPVPALAAAPASPDAAGEQCAQLLALADQLQSEMKKTTKDMLSVGVMRKASEIEKLARAMRSK